MYTKTLSPLKVFTTSAIVALLALCFTSCDTENIFPEVAEQAATVDVIGEALGFTAEEFTYETAEGEDLLSRRSGDNQRRRRHYVRNNCFRLAYPVTVVLPDSSEVVADSAQALRTILHDWRDDNPASAGRPRLAMPYDVVLADSTTATITSRADLRAILAECRPDRPRPNPWKNRCYRLVFPVTVDFPDSTQAVADSAKGLKMLLRDWRMNHDPSEGRPRLAFPYNIRLRDSSIVTITSREDLEAVVGECRDRTRPSIFGVRNCFKLKFPVMVALPDSTFEVAESPEDLREILTNWAQTNDDVEGHPSLVFPYKVQLKNRRVVTIDNRREQRALLSRCNDRRGNNGPRNPDRGNNSNGG